MGNIESQLIALKLDLARKQDPWELISDPQLRLTLFFQAGINLYFILLIELGISSLYVLVDYKNKDIIDEFSEFNKIIPFKFLKTFSKII